MVKVTPAVDTELAGAPIPTCDIGQLAALALDWWPLPIRRRPCPYSLCHLRFRNSRSVDASVSGRGPLYGAIGTVLQYGPVGIASRHAAVSQNCRKLSIRPSRIE
jgi:hypothetical protein